MGSALNYFADDLLLQLFNSLSDYRYYRYFRLIKIAPFDSDIHSRKHASALYANFNSAAHLLMTLFVCRQHYPEDD